MEENTNNIEEEPTDQQKNEQLIEILQNLEFFSNQVRFNQTLYQGFSIILQKLTSLEESIKAIEETSKNEDTNKK